MRKFLLFCVASLLPSVTVFAQGREVPTTDDGFAYASMFAGDFSLLLSIVIGLIATFLVFRSAKKLRGGLFGIVLNYIGVGMSLVVFGTLSSVVGQWSGEFWLNILSTVLFAVGYIFMVISANKLLKSIMNT